MLLPVVDLGNPVSDHPLNRGLVGWWLPLPNNSGGSQLFDITGKRNHGTLSGDATWDAWGGPASKFGGLNLGGTNGKATTALTNDSIGVPFSVSAWFNPATLPGGGAGVLSIGGSTLYTIGAIQVRWQDNDSGFQAVNAATTLAIGSWYNALVTSTGSGAGQTEIYLAGIASGDGAAGGTFSGTNTLVIGNAGGGFDAYFAGLVTDVRVWNRALDASEARLFFNQSRLAYPDLLRRMPSRVQSFGGTSPPPPPPPPSAYKVISGVGGGRLIRGAPAMAY